MNRGYLARCLVHRLQDRTDISRLPDRLLLYIFSQLSVREIYASSQVCRRWRYLCATDELWIVKCHEMGLQENVPNITDIVLDANQDLRIDWKVAYNQLKDIVTETKETWQQRRDMNEETHFKDGGIPYVETAESVVSEPRPGPGSTVADSRGSRIRPSRNGSKRQVSKRSSGGEDSDESEDSVSEDLNAYISLNYDVASTIAKSRRSRSGATIRSTVSRRSLLKKSSKATPKSVSKDNREMEPKEDELQNTEEKEERLRQRKKRNNEEEEFALDVRPAYRQAENVVGHAGPKPTPIKNIGQMVGKVNAVKRVRRLQGHMNGVLCVDYDHRRLMSGSLDRTIRIWDIRSGRGIHKLHGHKGGVRCLQFNNERLYSGSWDRTIMVWDIVHFQRIAIWSGHTDAISCLHLGKDLLVSGSHDTTVRVWSLTGPLLPKVIKGHNAPVTSVQLCGGYKQVLSGSMDMTLRLSDVKTGNCLHVYRGASSAISAVLVRGSLIVAGTSRGHLYFWSKSNTRSEAGVKVHDEAVTGLDFFKGRILTASEDTTVKEWDLNTLTCVRVLQGHRGPVQDVKVSKEQIVTCSDDGSVRIWDLFTPLVVPGDKNHEDSIHTELIDQRT